MILLNSFKGKDAATQELQQAYYQRTATTRSQSRRDYIFIRFLDSDQGASGCFTGIKLGSRETYKFHPADSKT